MRIVIACVLALIFFASAAAGTEPTSPYTNRVLPPAEVDAPVTDPSSASGWSEEDCVSSTCMPRLGWLRTDYLVWFIRRSYVTSLIQVIPDSLAAANDLPEGAAGTLFPEDERSRYKSFNGMRVSAGFWFDSTRRLGLDFSGFVLEHNSVGAAYSSNAVGSPILARFYVNANSGRLTSLQFSNSDPAAGYTGALSSYVTANSTWGFDANLRWNGYRLFADGTDYLAGGRYFEFRERLGVSGVADLADGTRLSVNDYFAVDNQFYGGQVGVHSRWCGPYGFSLDAIAKLAIGGIDQRISIRGDNTLAVPGMPVSTEPVGLYAQPGNAGVHSRTKFAVLPEVTLNLNYNLGNNAAIFVGYNVLWLNNVVRVGGAIDTNVNDANIRYIANPTAGNAAGPAVIFRDETFWLHGINLGLRLEY